MHQGESLFWCDKRGKEISPTSTLQLRFNQKETAPNKLFQYPKQSDKQ